MLAWGRVTLKYNANPICIHAILYSCIQKLRNIFGFKHFTGSNPLLGPAFQDYSQ